MNGFVWNNDGDTASLVDPAGTTARRGGGLPVGSVGRDRPASLSDRIAR
jgi:hypothetical protein